MIPNRTKTLVGGVLVLLVSIVVGLISFIVSGRLIQVDRNSEVLRIVVAVTGCTTSDTPEQCRQRLTDSSTADGARQASEIDCLVRRALAGLPAPIPPTTCINQTDPSVYPGASSP